MALEVLYGVDTLAPPRHAALAGHVVEEITDPGGLLQAHHTARRLQRRAVEDGERHGGRRSCRPVVFPSSRRSSALPRVVVGKWSDIGAVAKKLTEYGLTASAEQISQILLGCQRAGIAHHRPLNDDEFLAIALAGGAKAASESGELTGGLARTTYCRTLPHRGITRREQ